MDCILHTGSSQNGYGTVSVCGRNRKAHRVAWENVYGEIPQGYVVHHECGNPLCVNVGHLTLMTNSEHVSLHNPRSEKCQRGHDMSYAYVKKNGERQCRECQYARQRAWRRRQRG